MTWCPPPWQGSAANCVHSYMASCSLAVHRIKFHGAQRPSRNLYKLLHSVLRHRNKVHVSVLLFVRVILRFGNKCLNARLPLLMQDCLHFVLCPEECKYSRVHIRMAMHLFPRRSLHVCLLSHFVEPWHILSRMCVMLVRALHAVLWI